MGQVSMFGLWKGNPNLLNESNGKLAGMVYNKIIGVGVALQMVRELEFFLGINVARILPL